MKILTDPGKLRSREDREQRRVEADWANVGLDEDRVPAGKEKMLQISVKGGVH